MDSNYQSEETVKVQSNSLDSLETVKADNRKSQEPVLQDGRCLPMGTLLEDGRYKVIRYLASGGFGNTYLVEHTALGTRWAMKEFFMRGVNARVGTTVSVSLAENKEVYLQMKDKFLKEAQRMSSLKNEHIVELIDFFEENGTAYYVMRYIDGLSLSKMMEQSGGSLSTKQVRDILPQILDALSCIHSNKMLHLDLKPSNIMCGDNGQICLIDFGSSKQLSAANSTMLSTTGLSYTPGFAPSELTSGNVKRIGPWTDFYSLGATLYYLLTHQTPPNENDIMYEGEKAFEFGSLDSNMRRLILYLMTPQFDRRPQSVNDIVNFIRSNTGKVVSHKADVAEKGKRHHGFMIVLGCLLTIGIIAGAIWMYSKERRNNVSMDGEEKNFEWYQRAAEQGDVEAMAKMADYYFVGDEVPQSYEEAAKWYRKAAEQGNAGAQYHLGWMYMKGRGVNQDFVESSGWYRKAAEQGDAKAQCNLGMAYHEGRGVPQNDDEAWQWFHKSAEQGIVDAQYNVAMSYLEGRGVPQSEEKAAIWFRKAAEQGYTDAQYNLGVLYDNGQGVTQSYEEALKWYLAAAEQGLAQAQFNVGVMYEIGQGVDQNDEEAVKWYRKAAEQGFVDAKRILEQMGIESY